jgi:hypothetical protein
MGKTIAFSVCNKPFKPLGIPSGRVKPREDLTEVMPTNTLSKFFLPRIQCHRNHGSYSFASLKLQNSIFKILEKARINKLINE